MKKMLSRNFILSVLIFATGTFLAYSGKLSWEWIVMSISSFSAFGILEVIKRQISSVDKDTLDGIIKGISK
ncbi:MAG: hypothetical protein EOM67_16085 [Spirochaetia bacterium]|nr:hypothetical protein [Spirochaetia bacterium]